MGLVTGTWCRYFSEIWLAEKVASPYGRCRDLYRILAYHKAQECNLINEPKDE